MFIDDVQLFQDNDNPKVLWSQGIVDGKGNSAIIVHGGQWLRIKPTASLNEVSGKYSHALFAELTSPITSKVDQSHKIQSTRDTTAMIIVKVHF